MKYNSSKVKYINYAIIIFAFLIVILFPFIASFLGIKNDLKGAEEKVEFRYDNIDEYVTQNFPGRAFLMRMKNQIMYSLFDVSPNELITKVDDTLYSVETLDYFYHGHHSMEKNEIDVLLAKIRYLNAICNETGKKLVVITTPTKPRYVKKLPFADELINAYQNKEYIRPYEIFKEELKKTDVNYFDCADYIDTHMDSIVGGEVPLFYNSGHHWSNYKGNLVGLGFMDFMRKKLNITLPDIVVTATPSDIPKHPDADLFEVLNVYDKPNEKYYESVISYNNIDYEELNYLVQGGSFLGGFLIPYWTIGLRNNVIHIENKAVLYNKYKASATFETFDELNDKINLLDSLKETNIIILEIHEVNIYNATFGFIDYLLEHKDKF